MLECTFNGILTMLLCVPSAESNEIVAKETFCNYSYKNFECHPTYKIKKYNESRESITRPEGVETNNLYCEVRGEGGLCILLETWEYEALNSDVDNYLSIFMRVVVPMFTLQVHSADGVMLYSKEYVHSNCWEELVVPFKKNQLMKRKLIFQFLSYLRTTRVFFATLDHITVYAGTESDITSPVSVTNNPTRAGWTSTTPKIIDWTAVSTVATLMNIACAFLILALCTQILFFIIMIL